MRTHILSLLCFFFLLSLSSSNAIGSGSFPQSKAITGLKTVKVYFDVNMGEPDKLVLRLQLIEKTLSQLEDEGIQPVAVIAFRGKASKFMTNGNWYVEEAEQAAKVKVHQWLETFAKKGIHMEQCLIAAELHGIAPKDFRPELQIVANGYISMAAYQNRGFAMVPMD